MKVSATTMDFLNTRIADIAKRNGLTEEQLPQTDEEKQQWYYDIVNFGEAAVCNISKEGKAALEHIQDINRKYMELGTNNSWFNRDPSTFEIMAVLDPAAYKEYMDISYRENKVIDARMKEKYGSFRSIGETYTVEGPGWTLEYYKEWAEKNEDKLKTFYQKLKGGRAPMASDFEKQYDAELLFSNDGSIGDMFHHVRQVPSKVIMEMSVDQYVRIHDKKDETLRKVLEETIKNARIISERLYEAAGANGLSRLEDARIGFVLNETGNTTFYVSARNEEAFTLFHDSYSVYASKDIDELVQNVINKENGMSHFQYID